MRQHPIESQRLHCRRRRTHDNQRRGRQPAEEPVSTSGNVADPSDKQTSAQAQKRHHWDHVAREYRVTAAGDDVIQERKRKNESRLPCVPEKRDEQSANTSQKKWPAEPQRKSH